MPNISIRESIRWLPDPASEPTRTVVITSAERRYVDIRILHPPPQDSNETHTQDWAIAGTSSSEIRKDGKSGKSYTHSTWHHWIDSRTRKPEEATDEGDMFPLDETRTLEKGRMANPATGELTDYEEIWVDEEPLVVRSDLEMSVREKRVCVVLELEDDRNDIRGLVVRVGQYAQGMLRFREGWELEQWTWTDGAEKWTRTCKVGSSFIPCNVAMEDGKLEIGSEVEQGEYVWKVVELSCF